MRAFVKVASAFPDAFLGILHCAAVAAGGEKLNLGSHLGTPPVGNERKENLSFHCQSKDGICQLQNRPN